MTDSKEDTTTVVDLMKANSEADSMVPRGKENNNNKDSAALPLDKTLGTLLEDTELHDLILEASDGTQVTACRCVLAARSPVFKTMLYGAFEESSSKTIQIDQFDGQILKYIVDYLHCDSCPTWEDFVPECEAFTPLEKMMTQRQTFIQLTEAADFFHLPGLCGMLESALRSALKNDTDLSFAFVSCPPILQKIQSRAWKNIHHNKNDILSKGGPLVECLPSEIVELILSNDQDPCHCGACEMNRFFLLSNWSGGAANRFETAKQLFKNNICLEVIDPNLVESEIEPSGLASQEQLLEVYKAHALCASRKQKSFLCSIRKQKGETKRPKKRRRR